MLMRNSNIWETRIQSLEVLLTASSQGRDEIYSSPTACQVGLDPPLVSVSPNPEFPVCRAIEDSGYFGLNFLAASQYDLIKRCVDLDRDEPNKLGVLNLAYEPTERGTPLLHDSIEVLECKVEHYWDNGDHRTYIGRPIERRVLDDGRVSPLRFGGNQSRVHLRIKRVLYRSHAYDLMCLTQHFFHPLATIERGTRDQLATYTPPVTTVSKRKRTPEIPGLCLVGCGWWGRVHGLELKHLGARVHRFFASRTLDRAREFARRFDGEDAFEGLDSALADPRVHGVVLALPHHLHADATRAALQAGKHVLVEKPLALSPTEGLGLVEIAKQTGLCLAVSEQYLLSPLVQAAWAVLRQGQLGQVRLVRAGTTCTFSPAEAWKTAHEQTGGGVLLDVGIHYIDILRHWFGEPESVRGAIPQSTTENTKVEQTAVAVLCFPKGPVATLQISWAAVGPPNVPNIELLGNHGALRLWFDRPYLVLSTPVPDRHWSRRLCDFLPWRLSKHIRSFVPLVRQQRIPVPGDDLIGSRAILEDFLDAITTGMEPAVPGAEGLRDLEVVRAAYDSLVATPAERS